MKNILLKIACVMTGSEYEKVCISSQKSKNKIYILCGLQLIPIIIWALIGFIFSTMFIGMNEYFGIIAGLVMGFIIFVLDRALIQMVKSKVGNVFRISLAVIVSVLGAVITDSFIFNNDIEQIMKQKRLVDDKLKLEQVAEVEFNELNRLDSEILKTENEWIKTQNDIKQEADGTGGSKTRGVDQVVMIKLDVANNIKNKLDELKKERVVIESKIAEKKEQIKETYVNNTFLIKIKTLKEYIFSDSLVMCVSLLFLFFIGILESIVMIYKYSSGETDYDLYMKRSEEIMKNRINKLAGYDVNSFNPEMVNLNRTQNEVIKNFKYGNLN